MVRDVGLLWRSKDGCEAYLKDGGCFVVENCWYRYSSPTYFATSMPSCGYCALERYDNNSMVRGVKLLLGKEGWM